LILAFVVLGCKCRASLIRVGRTFLIEGQGGIGSCEGVGSEKWCELLTICRRIIICSAFELLLNVAFFLALVFVFQTKATAMAYNGGCHVDVFDC
jgi:hypothetical protein